MAGDTANAILSPIIQKLITPVVDAIGRQFGYLFFYKRNIKNLDEEVKKLENSRDDVDKMFEAERRNNKEISQSGATWLSDVKEKTMVAKAVEAKDKLNGGCLNLKSRYVLSRKSTKLATDIRELQVQAPKLDAANPALPAGMLPGALSNDASKDFKTRTEIMDKVMEALKDDTINIIGICGLGGIGKTTILHEVRKRATSQKLFDEVSMTTVSQDQNLSKIQSDLADMLGLTTVKDVDNIIARADLLHKRLTNGNTILVVLDDVWSAIKLKEVGIPVGNDRSKCKVILASRYKSVCADMGTQKTISVEVLSKEEAWHLFKNTAGDCVEKEKLEEIAKEVADECGGLPIALVTLASALSNKKRAAWEDACKQLKQSCVTSIPEMNKNVYLSLRLSYDFLKGELPEAQPLLLLCCQHREDAEINVENLARYCLALDLFKNVDKLVDARNRTYAVIERLKSWFLLQAVDVDEEGNYEAVKMHDVVRDVCLSIVSEVNEERDKVYMHIMARAAGGGYELGTSKVDYPKLKLLMNAPLDGNLLDISLLQRMEGLRVFESREGRYHPSFALQVPENLRMLSLEGKSFGEEIMSTIGSRSKLEILSFWHSRISSFPHQIGQLSNLKLLDLRCDKGEGPIPSGILQGLNKLEVLFMGEFRLLGAAKDKDSQNGERHGRIIELDSLSNLTTLQIILEDPNDLQGFRSENLKNFFFGSFRDIISSWDRNRFRTFVPNTIKLGNFAGMKWILGAKIQHIVSSTVDHIVSSTVDLQLKEIKDWTDPLILEKFVSLNKLILENCKQLEYIIPEGSLGKLQRLVLIDMPMMRHLGVGLTNPLCFGNLIEVKIYKCPVIESVFPHSAAKSLVQLQTLKIDNCPMLVGIVSKGELSTSRGAEIRKETPNDFIVQFPKLRDLFLRSLPNLGGFYNLKLDDGTVQPFINPLVMLPSLKELRCFGMPQLKQIVGGGMLELFDWLQNLEEVVVANCDSLETVFDFEGLHVMGENAHVLTFGKLKYFRLRRLPNLERLCRQIPEGIHAFQNLGTLDVYDCDSLGYLISSSMAHMLVNLKTLSVENCKSMKEVIKSNEDCGAKKIVFRSLSYLVLRDLEKISLFCSSDQQSFDFPSLDKVSIYNCPEMKTFCSEDGKFVWKGNVNETERHLNARNRVNQINSDLKDAVPEEGTADEYAECTNEDDSGSSRSILHEQGTPMKALMPLSIVSPSPPVSDNNEESVNSSSLDSRKVALPPLNEFVPSTSMEQSVHSSDSPLSSRDDDWKRKRFLIQGVYVKAKLKTSLEEILTTEPNFLSSLRLKTARMRTDVMESAIRSLQILRQYCTAHTISSEELAYIKDTLDDFEVIGLDTAWLKRGYQTAILVMKEQKVASAAAELAMLERVETEDEAAFEMARAKLEASKARREAFKAEYGALMRDLEAGKELFGGGFDLETSLGDGSMD